MVLEPYAPFIALTVVGAMLVLFVRERYPPEVVALGGVAVLLFTGALSTGELRGALANSAPLTIAAMFILSGALVRTGALDAFTRFVLKRAEGRPILTIAAFAGVTLVGSAFMNNTPIVMVMIPIAVRVAAATGRSASRLLMPLSYTAILGGMCTLIGSSTNILVDGMARRNGMEPFTMFEMSGAALLIAAVGLIYMVIAAPHLLPDRASIVDFAARRRPPKFFTEVVLPAGSPLSGQRVLEIDLFKREGGRVIDVLRGDESLRRRLVDVELRDGDRVVLRSAMRELLTLREREGVDLAGVVDSVGSHASVMVEALIGPESRLVGRMLGQIRLRRRYGVYPLAVHRRGTNLAAKLEDVRIAVGDTLLLEGAQEDIRRLADDMRLTDMSAPTERPLRVRKAPLVLATIAAVVLVSALGWMPIAGAAVIGVAVVLFTGCIDADEAFGVVDGRLLVLIFSMLAIGYALDSTGAVRLLVEEAAPWLTGLPPGLVLYILFFTASVLTELVTNNAVAVLMTPIAIGLAQALGVDPRPFVVAVMFAASTSFATPIGYQTNTLVYAPGGYKFTDYLRMGTPMNLIIGAVASLTIPVFWPF